MKWLAARNKNFPDCCYRGTHTHSNPELCGQNVNSRNVKTSHKENQRNFYHHHIKPPNKQKTQTQPTPTQTWHFILEQMFGKQKPKSNAIWYGASGSLLGKHSLLHSMEKCINFFLWFKEHLKIFLAGENQPTSPQKLQVSISTDPAIALTKFLQKSWRFEGIFWSLPATPLKPIFLAVNHTPLKHRFTCTSIWQDLGAKLWLDLVQASELKLRWALGMMCFCIISCTWLIDPPYAHIH